jgi:hypothetical protein
MVIDSNRMGRNEINDYVIYKIVCLSKPDLVYVGSTANFYSRRNCHKASCNNPNRKEHNHKIYVVIRENGGWDNFNMVIVDELKQLTLIKSRMIEEEWRLKLNANLNSQKCFGAETKEEYYAKYRAEHQEKSIEYRKQYRAKNREMLIKRDKDYYENNKDIMNKKQKEYNEKNKEHVSALRKERCNTIEYKEKKAKIDKLYREANEEKLKEKSKAWYEANRETVRVKASEKITCVCGCVTTKQHLTRHMKTQKHLDFLAQQTTEVN